MYDVEENTKEIMGKRLKISAEFYEEFSMNHDFLSTLLFEKDNIEYNEFYCCKLWLKEVFLDSQARAG